MKERKKKNQMLTFYSPNLISMKLTVVYFDVLVLRSRNWNRTTTEKKSLKIKRHFKLTSFRKNYYFVTQSLCCCCNNKKIPTNEKRLCFIFTSSRYIGQRAYRRLCAVRSYEENHMKKKIETIQCMHTNTHTQALCVRTIPTCTPDRVPIQRRMCATVHIAASCPIQPYMAAHTHKPWHAHNHISH